MKQLSLALVYVVICVGSVLGTNRLKHVTAAVGQCPSFTVIDFIQTGCKMLHQWSFNCDKLQSLPVDAETDNYVRRNVKRAVFSKVMPTPLRGRPRVAAVSPDALKLLDWTVDIASNEEQYLADIVAGVTLLKGSHPVAHRYGGHQFGYWADQLGDGRAILLGEYINSEGDHWEVQLKGAGITPYSRDADGRAVIRSSVREFLASEAMYFLGVPTSRAAVLVCADDPVMRDQFYDGHAKAEPAAVVMRLAPSWFRFGSFEILTRKGEIDILKTLADFIIKEHFSDIDPHSPDRYIQLLQTVVQETAELVAWWEVVGFAHGVLNTDNMSILSLTIDYGPYGFVEKYDLDFVPNSSDDGGRYSYGKQAQIAQWNLAKLADALLPLLSEDHIRQIADILHQFPLVWRTKRLKLFLRNLGLTYNSDTVENDTVLVDNLLEMMAEAGTDFTMTFRHLGELTLNPSDGQCTKLLWALHPLFKSARWPSWQERYADRVKTEGISEKERQTRICANVPRYILRNWIAQSAIEKAEKGIYDEVQFLLRILKNPYEVNPAAEEKGYAQPPPYWAHRIRVSCSS